MTISSENLNKIFISLILLIFLMLLIEPAFALNVGAISKGVSGNDRAKMKALKDIVFYMGVFFSVLGIIIFIFRNSFSLSKRYDISPAAGPVMLVFGLILIATQKL